MWRMQQSLRKYLLRLLSFNVQRLFLVFGIFCKGSKNIYEKYIKRLVREVRHSYDMILGQRSKRHLIG